MRGLSHLSDTLLRKAYISKAASKKSILHRIAVSRANIKALESRNEFFRGMEEEATAELAMNDEELDCIRNVLGGRGINEADIEHQHAVYADDLAQIVNTGGIKPQYDSTDPGFEDVVKVCNSTPWNCDFRWEIGQADAHAWLIASIRCAAS